MGRRKQIRVKEEAPPPLEPGWKGGGNRLKIKAFHGSGYASSQA